MFPIVSAMILGLTTLAGQFPEKDLNKDQFRLSIPVLSPAKEPTREHLAFQAHMVGWTKRVLDAHNERVSSLWWKSLRSSAMSDKYMETAADFARGARIALEEQQYAAYRMLVQAETEYRSIAELILLGGRETVSDGTGSYTSAIAAKIDKVHKAVLVMEEETAMKLVK